MRQEIEKQIGNLVKHKILEPSTSEWNSPIVMCKKKDGTYRMACDFRELNKVSQPLHYPLPRADDIFDSIGHSKAKYFSSMDMASGFWQIPLDPETKHKTGIITHHGVWNWNKLPFGLMSAPTAFQKTMATIFRDLNWKQVLIYVDDILLISASFEDHLKHLFEVFQRLKQANLTLKPSKCHFALKEIIYLGYVITKDGIKADPSKTEVIKNFPIPKTQKQLRSAMGLFNFYRRFVQGFSQIAAPLNALLRKDVKFEWSTRCDKAFQQLKNNLVQAALLAYPDMSQRFHLTTDASQDGLGYILGQKHPDHGEVVIAYGGRGLHTAERNYSITELECLAVIKGIKAYHPYLANAEFDIYTDHSALKWLSQVKHSTGRLVRWSLALQSYQHKIHHKPGRVNSAADALSRHPYSLKTDTKQELEDILPHTSVLSTSTEQKEWVQVNLEYDAIQEVSVTEIVPPIEISKDIVLQQHNCQDLQPYLDNLNNGILPQNDVSARKLTFEKDNFVIQDEVLYHLYYPRDKGSKRSERIVVQLALPSILIPEALHAYHDSLLGGGHQGYERTLSALRCKYWFPNMSQKVLEYTTSCDTCQRVKQNSHKKAPLHPMPLVKHFERVHMDILGPLPQAEDKSKYVLLIVDSFSKWPEAFPLKDQEAVTIAKTLYKEIFTRYGAIKTLISDRGANFMSKIVQSLCNLFQIKRQHTSSFHPQTNSACERYNSFIAQTLRAYINKSQTNWPELLPGILMAFRLTPAKGTKFAPHKLLFGRDINLPFDTTVAPFNNMAKDHAQYFQEVLHQLKLAEELATTNIKASKEDYKAQYDKHTGNPTFRPGDLVLLLNQKTKPGLSPKLTDKYTGPYYITLTGPNDTYKLNSVENNKPMKSLVHVNLLKKYNDPKDRLTTLPTTPQPVQQPLSQPSHTETNTDYHQVEKILATKKRSGKQIYKVKWSNPQPQGMATSRRHFSTTN